MFGRTRYQGGSLRLEERKRGPAVWVYRWWEKDTEGKPIRRKAQLGNLDEYPNESRAQAAADALRLTINETTPRQQLREITIATLVQHYREHEMPDVFSKKRPSIGTVCEHEEGRKSYSTQETYEGYLKKWIVPRWGTYRLGDVKAVQVEQWLKTVPLARGSRAKIRNIMSALYSHAIRWEWTDKNPITQVRQSAKPYWPGSLYRAHLKPALLKAGISVPVGWHTLRHSFGTLMKANGEDIKTIQELLRHATFKVTADTYTQAVTPVKRDAQARIAKLILADVPAAKPVTPTLQ